MDDYLTKPIQMELLQETLKYWMPVEEPVSIEKPPETIDNKEEEGVTVLDRAALAAVLGSDDSAILDEFLSHFVTSSEDTVIEVQEAFSAEDLLQVKELAHKLKSSARTVGAYRLADCCQTLEQSAKEQKLTEVGELVQALQGFFNEVKRSV